MMPTLFSRPAHSDTGNANYGRNSETGGAVHPCPCPDYTCHADHDDEWEPWIQCFRLELEWIVAVRQKYGRTADKGEFRCVAEAAWLACRWPGLTGTS